jgi:hypothetical protein
MLVGCKRTGILEGEDQGNLAIERDITAAESVVLLAGIKGETKLQPVKGSAHWASAQCLGRYNKAI